MLFDALVSSPCRINCPPPSATRADGFIQKMDKIVMEPMAVAGEEVMGTLCKFMNNQVVEGM